jgi:SsrA-binding protein
VRAKGFASCGSPVAKAGEKPEKPAAFAALRPVARGGYDVYRMKAAERKAQRENNKIVAQNRAAGYNYELLDRFEAGIVLVGTEVKSLREGKASIRESYAEIRAGETWLVNCHIPEYRAGGPRNHDPLRRRKLLLNRREIEKLDASIQQKGMTVLPLKIYFRDGLAKCELAVGKGKKFHDRRESERRKEAKREADEAISRSRRR